MKNAGYIKGAFEENLKSRKKFPGHRHRSIRQEMPKPIRMEARTFSEKNGT